MSSDQTSAAADRIRSELLGAVRELERRRREAQDLPLQLRRHRRKLAIVSLGAAALVGGYFTAKAIQRNRSRAQVAKRRVEAFQRAWNRPERVATKPRPSASRAWMRKLLMAGATALASRLIKRLVSSPDGAQKAATYH